MKMEEEGEFKLLVNCWAQLTLVQVHTPHTGLKKIGKHVTIRIFIRDMGGCQLVDLIITEPKGNMTYYKF